MWLMKYHNISVPHWHIIFYSSMSLFFLIIYKKTLADSNYNKSSIICTCDHCDSTFFSQHDLFGFCWQKWANKYLFCSFREREQNPSINLTKSVWVTWVFWENKDWKLCWFKNVFFFISLLFLNQKTCSDICLGQNAVVYKFLQSILIYNFFTNGGEIGEERKQRVIKSVVFSFHKGAKEVVDEANSEGPNWNAAIIEEVLAMWLRTEALKLVVRGGDWEGDQEEESCWT